MPSADGLSNYHEYLLGFNPLLALSSGGPDEDRYDAVFTRRGDPWYPAEWWLDLDGDGLTNNYELYYQSSPGNPDTNGDGLSDLAAIFSGRSPTSNDTDGDGISNIQELINGTSPLLPDTDGDGATDDVDPLPLDSSVSSLPPPSPTDTTGPIFTLQQPAGAVLQP
jgi:Bacterial TSP3 repeat